MNKIRTYFGKSPRVITRIDNDCYEFLRYEIGFENVDEFINQLIKKHLESRGLNENNKR